MEDNKFVVSNFGLGVLGGLQIKSRKGQLFEGIEPGVKAQRRAKGKVAKASRKANRKAAK